MMDPVKIDFDFENHVQQMLPALADSHDQAAVATSSGSELI